MDVDFFQFAKRQLATVCCLVALILSAQDAHGESGHGIAMYGEPALPPGFISLPYANPDAPKGGRIVLGNTGGFDSLNPYIRKGTVPWQLRFLTHDTLMGRSRDEPFTLYGLLAESIETDPDRTWAEFTLRPEAAFSDGSPVTVEDILWSYETLGTIGHPRYHGLWSQITSATQTGPRSVKFTFAGDNRELALIVGMRPILKKAQWEGKDFAAARIDDIPIGAGPYVVSAFDAGRSVTLNRNPDYWGNNLNLRRGTHNFDEIVIDFYGDATVLLEGFKAGALSAVREFDAQAWVRDYEFPAVAAGDVIKTEISNEKPSGMTGFAMNTRRAPLDDWRVREALILAFNFEYINDVISGGIQSRITSYFSGSELGYVLGPASGEVANLMQGYADALPDGAMQGYQLPTSDGTPRNRKNLRKALKLLEDAGLTVEGGILQGQNGPVQLTLVLDKNNRNDQAIADIYKEGLERLGIALDIQRVDNAQFVARRDSFDFDLISFRRAVSLSPGNEQKFYWGSEAATQEGSRNLPGISSAAIDGMIDKMLTTQNRDTFVAAVRALDRLLTAGRYVIPFSQYDIDRIAHVKEMKMPAKTPIYGDGPEFMPQHWWWQD